MEDDQERSLASKVRDEELKEGVDDEGLAVSRRWARHRVRPTSYRSRTASIKNAASSEKMAIREEMA